MSVHLWAERYIGFGWQVVPLVPGQKRVNIDGWKKLKFTTDMFQMEDNIGIKSIDGLIIVDIDCEEAVKCADAFLPPTGAIYGRKSKPKSKRLYYCEGLTKIIALKDRKDDTTLIELRVNHQDMAPPSVHPSGEKLEWYGNITTPATVEIDQIKRAVKMVATASLMIRYYNPPGARHNWMLAFAGSCKRFGFDENETLNLVNCIAKIAGDPNVNDRLTEVKSTYARADDDPVMGVRSFQEECNEPKLSESLRKIWLDNLDKFKENKKGVIIPNDQDNIRLALRKLEAEFTFDRFARKQYVTYEKKKTVLEDEPIIRLWLEIDQRYRFRPGKLFFFDVVKDLAQQTSYHPVVDYLQSLEWDGTSRIEEWLINAAGVRDDEYIRNISKIVLVAAVRRIMKPGCKFDEMLVLESNTQGLEKSSMLQALCPKEEWFSDNLPLNVDSKQVIERTAGKWIIEAADLSGMRSSQVEGLKAMLSRQVDGPVRMAYAHVAREQPRQFVIIGTTNSYNYLTDPTGNRRFWPVRCGEKCDVKWVAENRDQLWAEAFVEEQKGSSIRLPEGLWGHAAIQQRRRTVEDPWEEILSAKYTDQYYRLPLNEVWGVLQVPLDRRDRTSAHRLAAIMQKLGFNKKTARVDGKPMKCWVKGETPTIPGEGNG